MDGKISAPRVTLRDRDEGEVRFLRRLLITLALVALALAAWMLRSALLLVFAGIVLAVMLLALARPIERRIGLSRTWSLVAVGAGLAGFLALASFLVGAEVMAQVRALIERLPDAFAAAEERFDIRVPLPGREDDGEASSDAMGGLDASMLGNVVGHIAAIGSGITNAVSALVVAVIGGFFIAADPELYRRGTVKLLPESQRERAEEAMVASGEALRMWLGSQLVSIVLIGLMAWLGTWALGLPSPVALGLFAGIAAIVPLVGAVAGAVPALLFALAEDGSTLLWTAVLFLVIQQIESNMIMPLLQKRMVELPPALVLFAVVAIGMLFGLPGVILAAPITVVAFVLVKKLYVRETLGHATEVPGEDKAADEKGGG